MSSIIRLLPGVILVALLFGCSKSQSEPPPPSSTQSFEELGEVYKYIEYSKLRPPTRDNDFVDYLDSLPSAFERIKNGEIKIAWGVGLSKAPGAANQVLAYEGKAATEGGAVLLRDGTVKQLTAAEFQAAPKAK